MNNDQKRIIIEQILTSGQRQSSTQEGSPAFSARRWSLYLMLIPLLALSAVLGVFFFAAFLALFAIIAIGLGLRLWWFRRKNQYSKPSSSTAHNRQHIPVDDIEDAHIIDERKTKTSDKT